MPDVRPPQERGPPPQKRVTSPAGCRHPPDPPPHNPRRSPELLADWRVSEQPVAEWCTENVVGMSSLRYSADPLAQPAPTRFVELARPGRAKLVPLRLVPEGVVIDVPDGFNDQTLARVLAVVEARRPSAHTNWP
jgi:hypothetical protein